MFKLEVPEMTCTTNKKAHGIHRERFFLFLGYIHEIVQISVRIKKGKNALNMSFSNYLMCYLSLFEPIINS